MNWTEGHLHHHVRGRGWSRDRSRQRQAFASARGGRARAGSKPIATEPVSSKPAASEGEESPFFNIGAFRESKPPEREEVEPPPVKRRKVKEVREVPVVVGDDVDARRQRLLARKDWTGISTGGCLRVRAKEDAAKRTTETETSPHFGASRAAPGLHLHHPKPIRRDGGYIVESLESLESHAHPEPAPHPRPGETPCPPAEHRPEHTWSRTAASAGTTETEDTDNLLPLSDTLPDVTVRLDILDSVESVYDEEAGEGSECGGVSDGDVSLAALLSSQSESLDGSPECQEIGPKGWGKMHSSCERVTSREESRDSEEDWLGFIFDDESEVVKRRAFEVATKDAARAIVPSVSSGADFRAVEISFPSGSSGDSRAMECSSSGGGVSDRATCGTGA